MCIGLSLVLFRKLIFHSFSISLRGRWNVYDCQSNYGVASNQGIVGFPYQAPYEQGYSYILGKNFSMQLCEVGGRLWIGSPNSSLFESPMKYSNSTQGKTKKHQYSKVLLVS